MLIYVGRVRPFRTKRSNKEDLCNEFFLCILSILLCLFSGYVDMPEHSSVFGWIYIGLLVLAIIWNLKLMMGSFMNTIRLVCKKHYKICRHKYDKKPYIAQ